MHALLSKMEPKCFPSWNFTPEMQLCRAAFGISCGFTVVPFPLLWWISSLRGLRITSRTLQSLVFILGSLLWVLLLRTCVCVHLYSMDWKHSFVLCRKQGAAKPANMKCCPIMASLHIPPFMFLCINQKQSHWFWTRIKDYFFFPFPRRRMLLLEVGERDSF